MKKKLLALLLAAVMAFSLLPTAFAFDGYAEDENTLPADGEDSDDAAAPEDGEDAPATSGECGENVTWSYADGVLTISGTGPMDDYYPPEAVPWFDYREDITAVIIEGDITYIGADAFYHCANLTGVTIPEGVTSIGNNAFAYSGLTEVNIPASVTEIGVFVFSSCGSLTAINAAAGNTVYTSVDGVLFNNDKTTLVAYPGGKGTSYVIPEGVTVIASYAFDSVGLTEVTIPEGVVSIGSSAFWGNNLTEVNIPANVTEIGGGAFSGMNSLTAINVAEENTAYSSTDGVLFDKEQTTLIIYPAGKTDETYTIPNTVTTIGANAFFRSRLTSVTIPESVTSIDGAAFMGSCLTEATIPEGITSIGDYTFTMCPSLTTVTIPASVTSIGEGAFELCESLTDINYGGTAEQWAEVSIGEYNDELLNASIHYADAEPEPASGTCGENLTWTLKDGVLTIEGTGAMYDYSSMAMLPSPWSERGLADQIQTVIIKDGVTSIGNTAFELCTNLTSVTIPNTVTSIGYEAFNVCESLTSVTLPNGLTTIESGVFARCNSLVSVNIPDSVTEIKNQAFQGCTSLTSITIPAGVTEITMAVFANCTSLTNVTIPSGVTEIISSAFTGCSCLISVAIPDSVTFIDLGAFSGCDSLTDVYYSGSESQWGAILSFSISEENPGNIAFADGGQDKAGLGNVTVYCNSVSPAEKFSDVAKDAWYVPYVQFSVAHGIIIGNENGTFNPEGHLTRAETFTILGRLAGAEDIVNNTEGFDPWYQNAVNWVIENGISDGSRPEEDITREEFADMLYKLSKEKTSADASILDIYPDRANLSGEAVEAMTWAVDTGIIRGNADGTLNPKGTATRAEAVTMLQRYCNTIGA